MKISTLFSVAVLSSALAAFGASTANAQLSFGNMQFSATPNGQYQTRYKSNHNQWQAGYHQGNFQTSQQNRHTGNSWNGYGNVHSSNRFTVGGGYATPKGSYGGMVNRNGGTTNVIGTYSRPGTIPGTVENYYGGVNYRGRHSNFASGGSINTTRGQRIGGTHQNLNGRGFNRQSDFRMAGASGRMNHNLNFRGINSSGSMQRSVNVGGALRTNMGMSASRNGIRGNSSMRVGGTRVGVQGSLNTRGANVRFNVPQPRINIPQPRINVPQPRINVPKPRKPSLSVGRRKIF